MKIGLLSVGFPNFRYDIAKQYLNQSLEKLTEHHDNMICCKETLIEEPMINKELNRLKKENIDLLILQCGTYSYGSIMMKVVEQFEHIPLILWGFEEPIIEGFRGLPLNSLCGLNMYSSFLNKVGKKFSYVYGSIDDDRIYQSINRMIKAIDIKYRLKDTRFCIIGGRVPGFYLSNVDELRFRHEIGPELIYYSLASLMEDCKKINTTRVKEEVDKMKKEVSRITSTEEMLEKSARLYLAVLDFKQKNGIDAFTIKCWPEFQQLMQCSVCGVVSRLNNQGIMTSCEGDVTGLATMYIQYLITKQPCFFADLVNINSEGIAKAWHCGPAPVCLARNKDETMYIEHPTIKQGMGFATEFKLRLGLVNVLKLKEGKDTYKLFVASGHGVEEDRDMAANQLDIKFDLPVQQVLDTIIDNGIEHHYAIVYDDIRPILKELCKWMNIQVV